MTFWGFWDLSRRWDEKEIKFFNPQRVHICMLSKFSLWEERTLIVQWDGWGRSCVCNMTALKLLSDLWIHPAPFFTTWICWANSILLLFTHIRRPRKTFLQISTEHNVVSRYLPISLSTISLSLSSIFNVISRRFSLALDLIGGSEMLPLLPDGTVKKILFGSSGERVVVSSGWDDAVTVITINSENTIDGSIFDFFIVSDLNVKFKSVHKLLHEFFSREISREWFTFWGHSFLLFTHFSFL